jgi:hypothetical protein
VPRPVKVVLVIGAFIGAFALGAYVASRTTPFPPEVDPGARPTPSKTLAPPAGAQGWTLRLVSRSEHQLHSGGSCWSDWTGRDPLIIGPDGQASSTLVAQLSGDAGCDFSQVQDQTQAVVLRVSGRMRGEVLHLTFTPDSVDPAGSQDLGGFVATLPFEASIQVPDQGTGTARVRTRADDGNDGAYRADIGLRLDCDTNC